MRFGVIGAGRWGRNIIQTIEQMPGIRVSSVASRNPATSSFAPRDCAIERDWRTLLRRPDVDAVAVAAPASVHAAIVMESMSAGLPAFVEKPLTCDLEEAERLLDLASRRRGYVLVDHVHLFSHAYRALKARLSSIGPVRHIASEGGAWGPFRADTPVLWDWGPHDAAFCLDLMGVLPSSTGLDRLERRPIDGAVGESLVLHASYPDGVTAVIRLSNLRVQKCRTLRVTGRVGALVYDDFARQKVVCHPAAPPGGPPEVIPIPSEPPLACALARFVENVSTGRTGLEDLRFGVDVVRMLDAWDTSR